MKRFFWTPVAYLADAYFGWVNFVGEAIDNIDYSWYDEV